MMIKSPYVSRLGGSADTFESRIKIPKALGELEEGSRKPGRNSIKTKARIGAWEESAAQTGDLAELPEERCSRQGSVLLAEQGCKGRGRPAVWEGGDRLEGAHGKIMEEDLQHCAKRLKNWLSELEKRLKGDEPTCSCAEAAAKMKGGCSMPSHARGAGRASTRYRTPFYKGIPPAGLGKSSCHGEGWRAKSLTASSDSSKG